MFLKSLTLKGFKSFADATTLQFEPGVTVVVGPNGSGKSNIVDAVAWVLGAQSPSALRSSKMDDVIFAGNGNRPALGRAEVILTIDNSAGLLPIGFSEVTLTRTLFRSSGESEYAINGVNCRLLDIQELLSDSGVGRTQHVIVSQGQLDSVLSARPEDRRTVVEEAAGILKYRRRRQKAERRLEATEANLVRLSDLLREVRRQLRPLERQADAARRHGDLVEELRALRLHVAGRELGGLQAHRDAATASQQSADGEERSLHGELRQLDADVASAEAALAELGGDEIGVLLGRFEAMRARAHGVGAVVDERRRSAERDRAAFTDQSLVAALEAESVRVTGELATVDAEATRLVPEAERLADAESELAAQRSAPVPGGPVPDGPVPDGKGPAAAELRGELVALRSALQTDTTELDRLETRLTELDARTSELRAGADQRRGEIEACDADEPAFVAALEAVDAVVLAADAEVVQAETRLREGEARRGAADARAEALAQALEAGRAQAVATRLAGLDGLVGALTDVVEVDPGWEAAFEAAVGEAWTAAVVADVAAARRALDALRREGVSGTVIALGALPAVGAAPPEGVGEPIRPHVHANPGLSVLLDRLLAGAVAVGGGLERAVEAALAHPDAVVVTPTGDRLAPDGWHTGGWTSGANQRAYEEAQLRAGEAAAAVDEASRLLDAARRRHGEAIAARVEPAAALEANDARLTAAADALAEVEAERRALASEDDALRAHLAELAERVGRARARVSALEARLPTLEQLEARVAATATLRTDLHVQAAGLEARRAELTRRLAEIDERLSRHAAERDAATQRRRELDMHVVRLERLSEFVHGRAGVVDAALEDFRDRARKRSEAARSATDRLDDLRRRRGAGTRRLEEVRELARRAEIEVTEARLRLEAAVDSLRREFECEPAAAIAASCPELPPGTSPQSRVAELERDLRIMGQINPLALEEHEALAERHRFLDEQLNDVKASRRELGKVIRAIDAEIVQIFTAAYADVADNFAKLFETLFPGGQGRLRLTDSDNVLDSGIEVEARPSGKGLRKLSLLSGGERSLTALAFLFAVFRSRPSPFYLLDEVEAALDDVNLHRFLDLLAEFREEAQLLVVTHQKRTMEAADCLYGVTMAPGSSSVVVSERVSAPS